MLNAEEDPQGKNGKKQGGARKGSGAKPKYVEPTKTVAFRVPVSMIDEIKHLVNIAIHIKRK